MSEPTHHVTRGVLDSSAPPEEQGSRQPSSERGSWDASSRDQSWESPEDRTATRDTSAEPEVQEASAETRGETTARLQPVREAEPRTVLRRRLSDSQRARLGTWLNPTTGIWIGLVLVAAGFVSIFYSWSKVAGVINVAQQMPYLVSGGITGLGLVIVGVTAVDVAVRRQDSHERKHQLLQIARTLDELRDLLEADDDVEQEWEE